VVPRHRGGRAEAARLPCTAGQDRRTTTFRPLERLADERPVVLYDLSTDAIAKTLTDGIPHALVELRRL
jgi:hypothetical protein